jgi:hypothetical protein
MEAITEKLERKLHEWRPETRERVRSMVAEIIESADSAPSRTGSAGPD